jgi:hypothetical protein
MCLQYRQPTTSPLRCCPNRPRRLSQR